MALLLIGLCVGLAPSSAVAQTGKTAETAVKEKAGSDKAGAEKAGADTTDAPAAETAPPPAPVAAPKIPEVQEPIAALVATIDSLEKAVDRSAGDGEELANLRFDIEGLASGAQLLRTHFGPRLTGVRDQIDALGPAPGKDDPPESAQVTAERDRLNAIAAEIAGATRTADLVEERANQLTSRVQTLRQALFAERVLARSRSPLAPTAWTRFMAELPGATRQITQLMQTGWKASQGHWLMIALIWAAVLVAYGVLTALVRRILAQRLDLVTTPAPSFFARAATAAWVAPALASAATIAMLVLTWGLDSEGVLVHEIGKVWPTVLSAVALFVAARALAIAILQPSRPQWRLVDLTDPTARSIARTISSIAAFYGADLVLSELARLLFMPLPVSVMIVTVSSVAIALLLLRLVWTPYETVTAENAVSAATQTVDGQAPITAVSPDTPVATPPGAPSFWTPRIVKVPLFLIALFVLGAVALGYVALGRFLVGQVIATGSAAVIVLLAHLSIRAILGAPGSGIRPFHTILSERAGLSEDQGLAVTRGFTFLLDVGLALVAIPLLLLTWGYTLPEALSWLKAAVFGFEIGQFRISFARIVLAILLFLGLLFLTRLIQRWLQGGPLQSSKIDRGIANSIHTAVGYSGFLVAALAAISYGGLDITSFAIVAGALSVGIGFGLQSIINNFVSGLILLVERPIKVGDLVAVGGREGRVRSIAVRSTEIETGDKASLIVPNSELITSTVTNWTHRNALGRVLIKCSTSFSADPEHTMQVLRAVLAECPLIMQHPAPGVSFDNFGINGFEFSISAVVADISKLGGAQTDLRLRIVKAFRTAGIEMPHPQSDIHLRDLDKLWALLGRVMAERAAQSAAEAAAEAAGGAGPVTPDGSTAAGPVVAGPTKLEN